MFNVVAAIIGNYNFMPKMTFLDNLILYFKELTNYKYNKKNKQIASNLRKLFLKLQTYLRIHTTNGFVGFLRIFVRRLDLYFSMGAGVLRIPAFFIFRTISMGSMFLADMAIFFLFES